jgi:hypothetical protein
MVVNYREQRIAPLIAFLLFVPVCLILLTLWADRHFPHESQGFSVRALIGPAMGLFYLFLIARTFRFNARVREEPRALQWDPLGLSLWQDGRSQRVQWPQVAEISVQQGRRPSYPSFLKIATNGPDGRLTRWRFASTRLQLSGQPLDKIAAQLEQARDGKPCSPRRHRRPHAPTARWTMRVMRNALPAPAASSRS